MIILKNGNILDTENFKGDVIIDNGKIKDIGKNIANKYDGEIIDCTDKFITPGFIDAHCHLGIFEEGIGHAHQDGNEMTGNNTAQVRVIDAFNPQDAAVKRAIDGGITTIMVVPGSANPIGGQGAILKLKSDIIDKMIVQEPAGLKMALGENPKRVYGAKDKLPSTRLGTGAVIRAYFTKVKGYIAKKKVASKEGKPFSDIDLQLEIGQKVLEKEIPARIHCHRKDDIVTAIRLKKEFGFNLVLEHATEGYKVADYIKENDIPVVLGPLSGVRSKYELKDLSYKGVKIINEKGILAAMMTDHPVTALEHANIHAGLALRYGSTEKDILKMLTINPAKILGIDNKTGSLEKGKDADVVVWNAHPFTLAAKSENVFIEGNKVK